MVAASEMAAISAIGASLENVAPSVMGTSVVSASLETNAASAFAFSERVLLLEIHVVSWMIALAGYTFLAKSALSTPGNLSRCLALMDLGTTKFTFSSFQMERSTPDMIQRLVTCVNFVNLALYTW